MDVRFSSLVLALYVAVGVAIICAISLTVAYVNQNPASSDALDSLARRSSNLRPGMTRRPVADTDRSAVSPEEHARLVQRMAQLESLLEKQTALLNSKSASLSRKTAQYKALEVELEGYLDLLTVMATSEASGSSSAAQLAQGEAARLRTQLNDLTTELTETQSAEDQLEAELETLRSQLSQAYDEMAEQQLDALLSGDDVVEAAASTVLVGLGDSAVEPVTELLTDERPEVRVWAASVLGQFGRTAMASVPALREALTDTDASVRLAADRALRSILD